jgi:hypothetical protein
MQNATMSVFGDRFFNIGLPVIWVDRAVCISLSHPASLSCVGAASAVQ